MLPPDVVGLYKAPEEERDGLRVDRRAAIDAMIPWPTCCEAARECPVVTFEVWDSLSGDAGACWRAHLDPRLIQDFFSRKGGTTSSVLAAAKFCPFCGAALPEMGLKSPVPETVCRPVGGYCDNCKCRLCECLCDPPEFAYERRP